MSIRIKKTLDLLKSINSWAYAIPIVLSLLLIPLIFAPNFVQSFVHGKELVLKFFIAIILIYVATKLLLSNITNVNNLRKSILFWLISLQVIVYIFTDILSPTPLVTIYGTLTRGYGLVTELSLLVLTYYTALTLKRRHIKPILKALFASGLLISLYAILQKCGIDLFFKNYDTKIFGNRVFGLSGNPSYLGQIMMIFTLIGAYLTIKCNHKLKLVYALGTAIFFYTIILSGTRTAIMGLIFAILLMSLKYREQLLRMIKNHKIIITVLIITSVTIFTLTSHSRFSLSKSSFRSLHSRFEIWNGTVDLIKDKPILGYGGETFYIYFPEIVTKKFFTLEENLNINADRLHNETLEIIFNHGILGLIVYFLIFIYLLTTFFKSKTSIETILTLIILSNTIQNQFSFPDIAISTIIAFCLGGLMIQNTNTTLKIPIYVRIPIAFLLYLITGIYITLFIFNTYMSQRAYRISHDNYSTSYEIAINNHKEAINYTPYYSELWYELMIIDPSSMKIALENLEQIDGDSGNVLAWKGNFYSKTDFDLASSFYIKALEKNPHHPNWIRAFADMLYTKGDYKSSLFLYSQYLDAIPEFWKWSNELYKHTPEEQKSYETFFKHTPYFWKLIDKISKNAELLSPQ